MAFRHIVNLSNSIVGVSLLSMPYCFATTGIVLSILTIIASSFLNRFACHLILRSARISKRRNFEALAFNVFGSSGKMITEIAILGFLSGSCVAFFVVIGDLCPSLITELFDIPNYTHLRTFTMMFLGMFVALPLCLKRRVEASFSTISMFLYLLLAVNLFTEAFDRLTLDDRRPLPKLNYWNFNNYFQVLPIFITCLSCQPQLFEIFDHSLIFSEEKNSIARINETIKHSMFLCSLLYITVGLFGYLAFLEHPIEGNLLVDLPHSLFSILAKLGFLFTIVFSLPLCLFPCRTSLHSLLYRKATSSLLNEMTLTDSYIPDDRWLFLTVLLICVTICISIILPHIEWILGIIGSTTGATICLVLPSLLFINLSYKNTGERLLAFAVLVFGVLLLFISTFTLISVDQQELTSQGQMVKNLNLSTNRIEKLIEGSNSIDQLKIDSENLNKLAEKLDELKSGEPKHPLNELNKSKSAEPAKDANNNELKSDDLKKELKNSNSNDKDPKRVKGDEASKEQSKEPGKSKPSNKEKSGFINAVEMKKKGLSREKLEEKLKEHLLKPVQRPASVNQSKPESKVVKNVAARPLNRTASNSTKADARSKSRSPDKKVDAEPGKKTESKVNGKLIKEPTQDSKETKDKNGIKIDIKVDSNLGSLGNKADQAIDPKVNQKLDLKANQKVDKDFRK